jgi:hypothetical protein
MNKDAPPGLPGGPATASEGVEIVNKISRM